MRRTILFALILSSVTSLTIHAQTADTISTGPGYSFEAYYDLEAGVVTRVPLDEWDIGFQVGGFAAGVITNGGAGVTLYQVPDRNAGDIGTAIDTLGMAAGWTKLFNSPRTWEEGAFSVNTDVQAGDFGWGQYNVATHIVSGTKLYVLVLPDGTARQIAIEKLASGAYTFTHAALDGSGSETATVRKSDFDGKSYAYYSIRDRRQIDREPPTESWDLLFGKYVDMAGQNLDVPYIVTGARSNQGVQVAEVESADPATEPAPSDDAYTADINEIGYDWKEFAGRWSLRDVAYFVKEADGSVYRVVFTAFGGSGTGDIILSKDLLSVSSVDDAEGAAMSIGLYPSVVDRGASTTLLHALDRPAASARYAIVDPVGRVIRTGDLDPDSGLHQTSIDLDVAAGVYLVAVDVDGIRSTTRMIVR